MRVIHTRSSCGVRLAAVARAQKRVMSLLQPMAGAREKLLRLQGKFKAALEERKLARKRKCPLCKQYAKRRP